MYRNLDDLRLFSGNAHRGLAEAVAKAGGLELSSSLITNFADGEIRVEIKENVRGLDVVIIQPTCNPVNTSLMELLIMADAFRRASARSITAVIPYFGYARQDKKVQSRAPVTARLVAGFLEQSGVTRVVTIDAHSEQLQGFFSIPSDHLYAGPIFAERIKADLHGQDLCVVSPDVSGTARADYLATALGCDTAVITKKRISPNEVIAGKLIGDVAGKTCIITDDMMDTCGTLQAAIGVLLAHDVKDIYVACTHAVFSNNGLSRLIRAKKVYCLDTIPITQKADNLVVLSSASLLANAIKSHQTGGSVSTLFADWRKG